MSHQRELPLLVGADVLLPPLSAAVLPQRRGDGAAAASDGAAPARPAPAAGCGPLENLGLLVGRGVDDAFAPLLAKEKPWLSQEAPLEMCCASLAAARRAAPIYVTRRYQKMRMCHGATGRKRVDRCF
jgi:hypothetical protein